MSDEPQTAPESACLIAQSERQAMDWSLVLTSQEISSTVLPSVDQAQWVLVIDQADRDRAVAAIAAYQLENAHWGWRQKLPWTGIIFHWGAVFWAAALICFHGLQAYREIDLRPFGVMDSAAVLAGQWWRLFTAVTLHADGGHLAANASTGLLLLGLAMARFGAGWAVLASFLAGVLGNVLGLLLYPLPHRGLGASGMVMGALGLVTVQSLSRGHSNPLTHRLILSGVFAGTMLFILLGMDPRSDVIAHLGGFLGGLGLGGLLAWLPEPVLQRPNINTVVLAFLLAAILIPWRLAGLH